MQLRAVDMDLERWKVDFGNVAKMMSLPTENTCLIRSLRLRRKPFEYACANLMQLKSGFTLICVSAIALAALSRKYVCKIREFAANIEKVRGLGDKRSKRMKGIFLGLPISAGKYFKRFPLSLDTVTSDMIQLDRRQSQSSSRPSWPLSGV
ncbi:hypothetical protein K438DRAFT_1763200 [Mycena galopus ATCC 62051]|nr:hypothetical protein K438DRAFT_1763200 [Mycena galopus ATCC 62051]